MKAKSVDDPHFRHAEREFEKVDEPALVQMDFTLVQGTKIWTLYCLENGWGAATVIPTKTVEQSSVSWIVRTLDLMGLREVCLQTDQEPAIKAMANGVVERRSRRPC